MQQCLKILAVIIIPLLFPFSSSLKANSDGKPLIYGHSYKHFSKAFNAQRRYFVSLPEQYELTTRQYPTLYIVDADFQFHHVANVTRHLARMGKVPPMIVIGVANQGPADYLKSNTWKTKGSPEFGGVATFKDYLYSELVPEVNKVYRTNSKNALAGYSLGGLFVLQSYLDKNSPFNAFLAMSPSIWYDELSLVDRFEERIQQNKKVGVLDRPLFLSLANEKGMGVTELVTLLTQAGDKAANWQVKHYPDETHYTTALPALYDGLQFLAPNYFTDLGQLMAMSDYTAALEHFAEKKRLWTGFRFDWLQSYTFSKYVFYSEQAKVVDDILLKVKTLFPDSYNEVVINLALGFNRKENFTKAKQLLESIGLDNLTNPKWHYQLNLALQGLGQSELAIEHHQKAVDLARAFQLDSWEVWEMEPE